MKATVPPNIENAIQAQLQCIAQSYLEFHALHPKRSFQHITKPSASHLSMVTKTKGRLQLTNPSFNIEDCLESLYAFADCRSVLSSLLLAQQNIVSPCFPPVLPKKTRSTLDITLILDLDETLLHASLAPISQNDHVILFRGAAAEIPVTLSSPVALRERKAARRGVLAGGVEALRGGHFHRVRKDLRRQGHCPTGPCQKPCARPALQKLLHFFQSSPRQRPQHTWTRSLQDCDSGQQS